LVELVAYKPEYLPVIRLLVTANKKSFIRAQDIASDTLPRIGYVAMVLGQPTACGFLRVVEGGFGMIDTLVTNPTIPAETRHRALTELVDRLIEDGKIQCGMKAIFSHTQDPSVIKRAEGVGFSVLPESVIGLVLTSVND
jgi:hypothetical protein